MTLMVLYGIALALVGYVAVVLATQKNRVEELESEEGALNLLGVDVPVVVEKRVQLPEVTDTQVKDAASELGVDVKQEAASAPSESDRDSCSWYSTKIRRPLPESFRRSTRGTEQFYLRDLDPIFRES